MDIVRVTNQQLLNRSILLDKIDKSQGNSEGYARRAKQQVYVPYSNPLDSAVKGYSDLSPTDEVLLAMRPTGSIGGLEAGGYLAVAVVDSTLLTTPTTTNALVGMTQLTVTGTTYLSVSPDVTYLVVTNLSGVDQTFASSAFDSIGATTIVIALAAIAGTPTTGWKVSVMANSKVSNQFTIL